MNIRKRNVLLVTVISVVMAILRTLLVSVNLEKNSGNADIYYLPENFAVIAFAVASAILLLAFLVSAFKFGRKTVELDDASIASSVGSLIASFALIGTTIAYSFVFDARQKDPDFFANGIHGRDMVDSQEPSVLEIFVIAFAVASALKFLLIGIRNHRIAKLKPSSVSILTLFPIIFSALRLLYDFVETSAIPFASSNAYHMVSLIAVLLFFLTEGKAYVSESKAVLTDFYGYTAIFMLSVFAIPNFILHVFGTLTFDIDAAFSIADTGIAVYVITKLYSSKTTEAE